jgi:FkbM family methyltransferase
MNLNAIPFFWRAERLADQISFAFRTAPPSMANPGRWGVFKLRRNLDHLRASKRTGITGLKIDGYAHPVFVRAGTSDLDVVMQLMGSHELGFDLSANPQWIVDLGANIGLSAIYLANRFPSARILAIEVERENYELLVRNAQPYPQITPIHKAVWHTGGAVRITNPEAQPWSFRVEQTTSDDPDGIEAISINDLLADFGISTIDLVKMDIEGAELEVLSTGTSPWLERTRVLAVELHERYKPGCTAALDTAVAGNEEHRQMFGEYVVVNLSPGKKEGPSGLTTAH